MTTRRENTAQANKNYSLKMYIWKTLKSSKKVYIKLSGICILYYDIHFL